MFEQVLGNNMLSNTMVEYFITALKQTKGSNNRRTMVFSVVHAERILNGVSAFANEIDDGVNIFDFDNIILRDLAGVHFSIYSATTHVGSGTNYADT